MLIRSVSGLRGHIKSHFTPEISINYARALNEMLPEGVIMAGRDSRPSGEFIMIANKMGFLSAVHDIADGGIAIAAAEMSISSGIGINIISNPKKTIYPATNLKKENIDVNPTELLNIFLNQFDKINKIYKVEGREKIIEMWNKLGHKIGEPVSVKVRDKKITGTYNGLSKEGGLLLINESGIEEVILAGDIFII